MTKAQVIRILGSPKLPERRTGLGGAYSVLTYLDRSYPEQFTTIAFNRENQVTQVVGAVLELNGKIILEFGDHPGNKVFEVLGKIDGIYDGSHLPGSPAPLRWPNLGLIVYAQDLLRAPASGESIPFLVGKIQLYCPAEK